ncbi:MAG: c-type cytochrome [Woeseiaceae bacterium]
MRRTFITMGIAIALALGIALQVAAETTAEDAVKYRQSIMTSMRGHATAISLMVRGKAGDPSFMPNHVRALSALTSELETVFQEGSIVHESEALPVIWKEPEEFAEALARVQEAAATLNAVAENGDMREIGEAFRNVGEACKGCHERFRKEHEH